MKQLIIIGASGHGKVIADIARLNGYTNIAFLDDDISKRECNSYPILGITSTVNKYPKSDFIVAIGNAPIREKLQKSLIELRLNIVTLIHPSASIAEKVTIGRGSIVVAGAVINPNTIIGDGCIINTCASVDHDCKIGDFVHVSVGAHIAGTVEVGTRTWIGAGATVNNNLCIAGDCIIGAGAVVVKDIKNKGVYIGVPSKMINDKHLFKTGGMSLFINRFKSGIIYSCNERWLA